MDTWQGIVLYVLVEGSSDKTALSVSLEDVFPEYRVECKAVRGDITTERGATSANIEHKIYSRIELFCRQEYINNGKDVAGILHLTDSDGVYIPERRVVLDASRDSAFYDSGSKVIRTPKPQNIIKRNDRKREIIDRLVDLREIKGIPYRLFYMSCNLDHVLYDAPNVEDGVQKGVKARIFHKEYQDRPDAFKRFIGDSDFSVHGTFEETWDYLRGDRYRPEHSMERLTNLALAWEDRSWLKD